MTQPRVLVIEHQNNAGSGLVGARLRAQGLDLHTVGPEVGVPLPSTLDSFDALVVMGGAMGPTEDDRARWLPAARGLLAEGVEREIPTLGICLGAQLLVTATGGRVTEMPQGPEIGLCPVRFTSDAVSDPVFGDLAGITVSAVQWHWLEADTLPASATVLASSGACQNQAFRIGKQAWGVQFHPEALTQTAVDWVEEDRENLTALGINETALVHEIRAAEVELTNLWGAVADRFAGVVLANVGATQSAAASA